MRKFFVVSLLIALTAASLSSFAQSRARRVGQSQQQQQQTQTDATPSPQKRTTADGIRTREVQEEVGEDEVVRVSSTLVTIPVTVLDRDGRFISALSKDDFRILEDGVEQEVAYFATVEQPFTVALVLDTSGSTRFKLEDIQSAAVAFVEELSPKDKVIVVSFDESVRVLSEATSDRRILRDAIRRTRTGGGTRLYDAVELVVKQKLAQIEGRKAVVLFTDGVDTSSNRASYSSTTRDAEELDAMIYPIQYDTYSDVSGGGGGGWPGPVGRSPSVGDIISIITGGGGMPRGGGGRGGGPGSSREDYARGGRYLRDLASLTGGRHHQADDVSYLRRAFSNIAEELRRQYSLGYYPLKQSQAAERRQIKVRVKRPNLVVRARDSYVYRPAGSQAATQDEAGRKPAPPEFRRRPFAPEGR